MNRCISFVLVLFLALCAGCAPSGGGSSDDTGGGGGTDFAFNPSSVSANPGDAVSFSLVNGTPPYQFGYIDPNDIQSYDDPADVVATFDENTGIGTYTVGPNPNCTDRLAARDSDGKLAYLVITVGDGTGGGGGGGSGSGGSGGQTGLYSVSISGRTTTIYCPEDYNGSKTYPLIVNLPGLGDSGSNAIRKWLPGVSPNPAEGYILVGCQLQAWPMYPEDVVNTADYRYVLSCIDYVRSKYNVNLKKTLLVGFSRGATMAFYFIHNPDRVNAICTMDGVLGSNCDFNATPKVPFYVMGSGMYIGRVNEAYSTLTSNGFDVTTKTFPSMGHGWPIDENPHILSWFQSKTN